MYTKSQTGAHEKRQGIKRKNEWKDGGQNNEDRFEKLKEKLKKER
jgi:hypothetical protein